MNRLVACAAMSAGILSTTAAISQGNGEPNFEQATSVVPPDFEAVLYAEADDWVDLFWQWYETGVVTPEMEAFTFTYQQHLPQGWSPFGEAYRLFEEIHVDKLQLDPDAGDLYYLDDLLDDDAVVRSQFKTYTTTGLLTTSIGDTDAISNHLAIIYHQNDTVQMNVTDIWVDGAQLATVGNTDLLDWANQDDKIPPLDCDGDAAGTPACVLKELIEQMLEDSDITRITYQKDGWWSPGFDCDDYTEAFWAWLKHRQDAGDFPADADIKALWLWWYFSWGINKDGTKHGVSGHAVVVIRQNGFYYIVDPMTGIVVGPYPGDAPYEDIDWTPLLDPVPGTDEDETLPQYTPDDIDEKDPTDRPWNDPAPWHTDPDIKDDVEDETGHDPDDFIYE
ncbi:MAG: hypothetical protein AAFN41_08165 [Planctomycetota bacterium]